MNDTQDTRVSAYRAVAKRIYESDDVEIDSSAEVSWSSGGAFVAAWVWVSDAEAENEPLLRR